MSPKPPATERRNLMVRLDAEMHQKLHQQAVAEDRSISTVVRRALDLYFRKANR